MLWSEAIWDFGMRLFMLSDYLNPSSFPADKVLIFEEWVFADEYEKKIVDEIDS